MFERACDSAGMTTVDLRWSERYQAHVGVERRLAACPAGHTTFQWPSWTGCGSRGHRIWSCETCHATTQDPDCPCQGGTGSTWGGRPVAEVDAEIKREAARRRAASGGTAAT